MEGEHLHLRAISAIPAGEEVLISYVPTMTSRAVRQSNLFERYGFVCACDRCTDAEKRRRDDALECIRCAEVSRNGSSTCQGHLLPLRRRPVATSKAKIHSDWQCSECKYFIYK